MSGIAALMSLDRRPADARKVMAMLAAIPYRGPDGLEMRAFERVVLGHAKLAITAEEEAEVQPLVSPRTGCAVVADVRLDNREELLATPVPPAVLSSFRPSAALRVAYHWVWPMMRITNLEGFMRRRSVQSRVAESWRGTVPSLILMGRRADRARAAVRAIQQHVPGRRQGSTH
jgi:hypothetical protein